MLPPPVATHSRASYFGLLAFLQLLALFFVVLVDDLQPCRWFHAGALVSWQLVVPMVLLLDTLPALHAFFDFRQLMVVGSMLVGITYDLALMVWLASAYLRDESHTSVSRCIADNGGIDFTERQSTADLFIGGALVVLAVVNLFGLVFMNTNFRYDRGVPWCHVWTREVLAMLTVPFAALFVGIQISESVVPNGYYSTGAHISWQLFLLLLPFSELGSLQPLYRGLALRDFLHFIGWLAASAQSLLVAMWLATKLGNFERGTRSCPSGRLLYGRERASAISQVVMLFGLGLTAAAMCALAARRFLRTTERLERASGRC
jgi:hypothetical protein